MITSFIIPYLLGNPSPQSLKGLPRCRRWGSLSSGVAPAGTLTDTTSASGVLPTAMTPAQWNTGAAQNGTVILSAMNIVDAAALRS